MAKENIFIVKASGERELWDEAKLVRSLEVAKAGKELIREIVSHLEQDLQDGMRTTDIYQHAFELLKTYNRPVAAEYSLRRALLQLGPSGFPFERFIGEILAAEGYKTSVGVMVQGACVEHEVDVVAEKNGERILVEAKYHNSPDTKSDVKVALYVNAASKISRSVSLPQKKSRGCSQKHGLSQTQASHHRQYNTETVQDSP